MESRWLQGARSQSRHLPGMLLKGVAAYLLLLTLTWPQYLLDPAHFRFCVCWNSGLKKDFVPDSSAILTALTLNLCFLSHCKRNNDPETGRWSGVGKEKGLSCFVPRIIGWASGLKLQGDNCLSSYRVVRVSSHVKDSSLN